MIKKVYQITIRDYNTIEHSGSIAHLKKWKFVPTFLVAKWILKEVEKANKLLNAEENDTDELQWKVQSLAKINAIQANVMGIFNLMNLGEVVNIYKPELKRYYRRKIKITDANLKVYFENVKFLTGIEIKTLGDLEAVVKELEFRKDKFQENFSKPKPKGSKVYLMQIVLGVFSFMNQPVNFDMTIPEFAIMRDEANEKLKREKTK